MYSNNVIYKTDLTTGKLIRTSNKIVTTPAHFNFLIVCREGDWSGFRTLAECEAQIPELEKYIERDRQAGVPHHERSYSIIERC